MSIYINSHHEFDQTLVNIIYQDVALTNESVTLVSKNSKHYQINTLALLYKINYHIKQKEYKQALVLINDLIRQNQNNAILYKYFTTRKAIIGILYCQNIQEYEEFLKKEVNREEKYKQFIYKIANNYYKKSHTLDQDKQ